MNTKICYKCKQAKDTSEFSKNRTKKDGYSSQCKICQKLQYKDRHYKHNRKDYIAKVEIRKAKIRQWYVDYKQTLKCQQCGENHPAVLDFHHLNPKQKEYQISAMIHSNKCSISTIQKEIDKCIILCANCHRKLHWSQDANVEDVGLSS